MFNDKPLVKKYLLSERSYSIGSSHHPSTSMIQRNLECDNEHKSPLQKDIKPKFYQLQHQSNSQNYLKKYNNEMSYSKIQLYHKQFQSTSSFNDILMKTNSMHSKNELDDQQRQSINSISSKISTKFLIKTAKLTQKIIQIPQELPINENTFDDQNLFKQQTLKQSPLKNGTKDQLLISLPKYKLNRQIEKYTRDRCLYKHSIFSNKRQNSQKSSYSARQDMLNIYKKQQNRNRESNQPKLNQIVKYIRFKHHDANKYRKYYRQYTKNSTNSNSKQIDRMNYQSINIKYGTPIAKLKQLVLSHQKFIKIIMNLPTLMLRQPLDSFNKFQMQLKARACRQQLGLEVNCEVTMSQCTKFIQFEWTDLTIIWYSNGNFYCGQMYNHKYQGVGLEWVRSNYVYYGEYQEGIRNGYGLLRLNSHLCYLGMWHGGAKDGRGKVLDKNGHVIEEGQYNNNYLIEISDYSEIV